MRQKILVRGPILTQSGYGEQARFAMRALRSHEDLFDIYILPVAWGQTGWVSLDNEERAWIDERIKATHALTQQGGQFDISLQITIPNEFEKIAPVNIGYTAGIETTKVAPQWLQKVNEMDKIIVVSNHSKEVFEDTVYTAQHPSSGQQIKLECNVPIEVVNYPVRQFKKKKINLNLDYDFNYLAISQWGPRKNFDNLINWFIEENAKKEVGLVLKTSIKNNSITDRRYTEQRLKNIISAHGDIKCKVYLLHGDLSEEEMTGLYQDKKIKCLISTTHGEGYGLPLFEAAYNGLPVACVGWSGQRDFLYVPQKSGKLKPLFAEIEYDLNNVQEDAVWNGVIQPESQWAFPREKSFKKVLRDLQTDSAKYRRSASKLKRHLVENFTEEKIYKNFLDSVRGKMQGEIKEVNGVSFCIPTNGAKLEKTQLEINSIHHCMSKVDIPYEIILSGDVSNFQEGQNVKLVSTPDDAHSGLLAKLRNNAGEVAQYNTIVFVDDDFVFNEDWAENLINFSSTQSWDILANKILLPDGTRFWDRCTVDPHVLVSYDFPSYSKKLYQTGGFWIMRKSVYENLKWDSSIPIYASANGSINEDLDMSIRAHQTGYQISFDKENTVWHNDDNYTQYDSGHYSRTLSKKDLIKEIGFIPDYSNVEEFTSLVERTSRWNSDE